MNVEIGHINDGSHAAAPKANLSASQNWRDCSLLDGIAPHFLDQLEKQIVNLYFNEGDYIVREGQDASCLFMIESGEVHIEKDNVQLATKCKGQHFGAMALMDNTPRSADVKAATATQVKALTVEALKSLGKDTVYNTVLTNHIKEQQSILRNMNDVAVAEMKAKLEASQNRVRAGSFFVTLVFWLVLYQFLLGLFIEYSDIFRNKAFLDVLNPSMMIIMGIAAYLKALKSDFSISSYGLNLNNWKKNLQEALIWTGGFVIAMILFKWFLVSFVSAFEGKPIFDTTRMHHYSPLTILFIYVVYSILAPVQEFIARGVIQSSLQRILVGKNRITLSIILSNLTFSGFHIHMDMKFAIMTLIPGIFWGIMYARQGSLLGVSISHIIIGLFALLFMGFV